MFANQPSYDQVNSGKRISGLNSRKGEFSLAWDSGKNQLNEFQRKKQKNQDVQVKLNYQEQSNEEYVQRPSQVSISSQPVQQKKPYVLESPYAQYTPQVPRNNPTPNSQNYDEDEVLGYLKQYEKIDDMPPEILGKVLAYYENLKNPNTQAPPSTQNQVPQDNSYQRRNSSRKSEAPSSLITAEKREPIKPRESAGGIIYGSAKDIDVVQKPSTSCTQKKNQGTFVLGDGYNHFQEEAQRKALTDQQNKIQVQQQVQQNYNPRNNSKKISNIHFG